jgi:hypothetical protein
MESAKVCLVWFAPSDELYWFQRQPRAMDTTGVVVVGGEVHGRLMFLKRSYASLNA